MILRTLKRLCIAVLLLLAGLVLLNLFDVEPSATTRAAMTEPLPLADADNFLIALYGFGQDVPMQRREDLMQAGQQIRDRYLAALAGGQKPFDSLKSEEARRLVFAPMGDVCGVRSNSGRLRCVDFVREQPEVLKAELAAHAEWLRRYEWLADLTLQKAPPPSITSFALGSLSPLLQTQRLYLAQLTLRRVQGDHAATEALMDELQRWRLRLQHAVTLTDKIMFAAAVRDVLAVAGDWMHYDLPTPEELASLQVALVPLSDAERSMKAVWQYETRFSDVAIRNLKAEKIETEDHSVSVIQRFANRVLQAAIKPNHTINVIADRHAAWALRDGQICSALATLPEASSVHWPWWQWPYNVAGRLLVASGQQEKDTRDYALRLCNLDGLLRIARLQARLKADGIAPADWASAVEQAPSDQRNPYTGAAFVLESEKALRFELQGRDGAKALLPWLL